MIDVQPYIDKLEALKEYMVSSIDGIGCAIAVNYESMPPMSPKEIIDIFYQTGLYFYTDHKDNYSPVYRKLTFEEYYQSKQHPNESHL